VKGRGAMETYHLDREGRRGGGGGRADWRPRSVWPAPGPCCRSRAVVLVEASLAVTAGHGVVPETLAPGSPSLTAESRVGSRRSGDEAASDELLWMGCFNVGAALASRLGGASFKVIPSESSDHPDGLDADPV
jgi:hypothetical protein